MTLANALSYVNCIRQLFTVLMTVCTARGECVYVMIILSVHYDSWIDRRGIIGLSARTTSTLLVNGNGFSI